MKKLFSVFALLVMALTTASATNVDFRPIHFTGSGTKTLTATKNGITLTIENATSDMSLDDYAFEFGNGTITITATGTNVTFKGVNLLGDNSETETETQDPKTGAGPWEYAVTKSKVNGSDIFSIEVEYEAAAPAAPAAPTFGTTQTKYLLDAEITITRPYDGAEVRYTTNNLTPTATSGEVLPADGKITVSGIPAGSNKQDYTIMAVTVKDGVASEVASLAIELIHPSISVSNIPAKYEGWTVGINAYSNSKEKLEGEALQSMVLFTSEIALQFTGSSTWAEHYAKLSSGLETVKDNKFETDAVHTEYFDTYFAIIFTKDGMTCGSEYAVLTTDKITADADGKFTVSSLSADALISGNLRSDEDAVVISDNEMELAALMGSTVYAKDDMEERFYVNNKGQVAGMIVTEAFSLQFTLSSMAEIVKDGDDYVASTSDGQSVYRFVVEDGKVTKIEGKEHGEEKKYLPSTELTLAALMGSSEYKNDDNDNIHVNQNGRIENKWHDGTTNVLAENFVFSLNADGSYAATGIHGIPYNYTFYVENNKVTKIEEYEDGALNSTYLPSVEDVLAALMGTTEYVTSYDNTLIHVNAKGKIEICWKGNKVNAQIFSYTGFRFSVEPDGNYKAKNDNESFIFYVENGKVTKIEEFEDENTYIYLPEQTSTASEDDIAALMGTTEYVNTENGNMIHVNTNGKIETVWASEQEQLLADFFTFSLKADGNYAATGMIGVNFAYIFYVENNKVTKIEESQGGGIFTYLPKQETPTAIEAPAAEKAVKAYKTIENGEIVIIRGGERFNLRGAKIK